MNTMEIANKFFAAIIAASFGLIAGVIVYCFLGLLLEPIGKWIKKFMGVHLDG